MKKSFQVSLCSLSLCLLFVSSYLLVKPISVLASDCSANCSSGTISVSGTNCTCTDYMGCSYNTQQGGSYTYIKRCK